MKVLYRLSVSGLVALACLSSAAQAEITIHRQDAGQLQAIQSNSSINKSSIYLVQMRDEPAIAYKGGLAGFKGTAPATGSKLQANSRNVEDYVAHLDATHNRAISSVNAEKVYSYRYGINGFAARMTAKDAAKLLKRGDVVQVWKDELQKLDTSTSPKYIGVSESGQAWSRGVKGENVVIGVIDSGIWPEHPSFSDESGSGADSHWPWQGHLNISRSYDRLEGFQSSGCDFGNTAANPADASKSCNDKLITARCYNSGFSEGPDASNPCGGDGADIGNFDFQSARDYNGHGSHTAATAGGNNGIPASIDGKSLGTVSGIAPRARIAAYKICWDGPEPDETTDDGCYPSDAAAAIDQAIADGVDVINYSISDGGTAFNGMVNIGFLQAVNAGIFVAASAGNSGPVPQTIGARGAPWLTAVGATQDNGVLGAGLNVILPPDLAATYLGMEGAGDVSYADTGDISGSLVLGNPVTGCEALANAGDVKGNIAFIQRGGCNFSTKYNTAAAAGARAIVVFNNAGDPIVMSAPGATIPGQMISASDGNAIAAYSGTGVIYANVGPTFSVSMGNRVSDFTSRGPNGGSFDLIKPDISAPGTAILAATSPASQGGEMFSSISGTSMASPHVAGALALIKQANPLWSPAMARSALMTTARQGLLQTFGGEVANPFDIGAGEILPTNALYPGLVYNAGKHDYLAFSCSNNVPLVSSATCNILMNAGYSDDASDLNIPSIAISSLFGTKTISRTVTNVARGNKRYTVSVDAPPGVNVSVSPQSMWLRYGQSATYEVTFSTDESYDFNWAFGSLTWNESSGLSVRSPIAILAPQIEAPYEVDSVASADGSGSVDVPVAIGYDGEYSATMSGLEEGMPVSDTLEAPGDSHAWCIDLPANVHTRIATFDAETTNPGEDDLDLTVYLGDADCDNITGLVAELGSSGNVTSNETVDIPYGPAGSYYIFVDHYSSPDDGPVDYTLWIQPVFEDNGNTTVTAPASAISGSNETVIVDYAGLGNSRYLGVLHHEDADGEIGTTIVDVDATAVVEAEEVP